MLALALFALPLVPAQAQSKFFSLTTSPVRFVKDGTPYFMRMTVTESGGSSPSASLSVQIFRTSNPRGVARSTQTHSFNFSIDPNSVDRANNLSTASIDTGNQLGPFGTINLNFSQNGRIRRSCNNHILMRAARRTTGTFDFNTQDADFGSVTTEPTRASLLHHDGGLCPVGGGGGRPPCPRRARFVQGHRSSMNPSNPQFVTLDASRINGARSGQVSVTSSDFPDAPASSSVHHAISAVVPGKNVVIANDLMSAEVRGAPGTGLSGSADFSSTGPIRRSGATTRCGRVKERLFQFRGGTTTGNLTAGFFIGDNVSLSDGDLDGGTSKLIVRNR